MFGRPLPFRVLRNCAAPLCLALAAVVLAPAATAQNFDWTGAVSGDWDEVLNWTPTGVPNGAGHTATIVAGGVYTVTLDLNALLDSFTFNSANATLSASGRTLTVDGPSTLAAGSVSWANSKWLGTGALTNSGGTFTAKGSTAEIRELVQNATLVIEGNGTFGAAVLTVGNPFTNAGTTRLDSVGVFPATLRMTGGGLLTNTNLLDFAGTVSTRFFDGALQNDGQVTVNRDTRLDTGPITNANEFDVALGAALTFDTTPPVSFVQSSGTLEVLGSFTNTNGSFDFDGGIITGKIELDNAALMIGPGSVGPGSFEIEGTLGTLSGDPAAAHSITVLGTPAKGSAILKPQASFTSEGVLTLDSTATFNSTLSMLAGAMTNKGTIQMLDTFGGIRELKGEFVNDGAIQVSQNTNFHTGPYTNNNSLVVATGKTLTMDTTPPVTFNQDAGTLDVEGAFVHPSGIFNFNGGTVEGIAQLHNTALNIAGPATGAASFTIRGTLGTLTGDVAPAQELLVESNAAFGSSILTAATGFTNGGRVDLDNSTSAFNTTLRLTSGALTNQGEMRMLATAAGTRILDMELVNDANLLVAQNTRFHTGPYTNGASIVIDPGKTLDFDTTPVVTFNQDGGTLQIDGTLFKNLGAFHYNGGAITGEPRLRNNALTIGPAATDPLAIVQDGTLSTLAGDVHAGQTLRVESNSVVGSSILTTAADFSNAGTIRLESIGTFNATLTLAPGTLTNDNSLVMAASLGSRILRGALINNGSFVAEQRTTIHDGPIANNGTFEIQSGVLLDFDTTPVVTFNQAAGILQIDGSFVHRSGTFNFDGGSVAGVARLENLALNIGAASTGAAEFLMVGSLSKLSGDPAPAQTVRNQGSSTLGNATLTAAASVSNSGLFRQESDGSFSATYRQTGGVFTNLGTVEAAGTAGTRFFVGEIDNQGNFQIDQTTRFDTGPVHNSGSIVIAGGTLVDFDTTPVVTFHQDGGSLQVDGSFALQSGTFAFDGGNVLGLVNLRNAALDIGAGSAGSGDFELTGASSTLSGDVAAAQTVKAIGNSTVGSATTTAAAGFTNEGLIALDSTANFASTLKVNGGPLVNLGELRADSTSTGGRTFSLELDNQGTAAFHRSTALGATGAAHLNAGVFEISNDTTTVTVTGSSFTNLAGGEIRGVGTLNVAATGLDNAGGLVAPGLSAGTLALTGDYQQGAAGTYATEIGGAVQGSDYDLLTVSGTATIAGTLRVALLGGYRPAHNDTFTVLTAGTLTGTFDTLDLVGFPLGMTAEVDYTGTDVVLTYRSVRPAGPSSAFLVLADPTPGLAGQSNTFSVSNARPGAAIDLYAGANPGSTAIAGCANRTLTIQSAQLSGSAQADGSGNADVLVPIPGSLSGMTVLFQAVEPSTCRLSNRIAFTFP